ncbi:MAG: 30S ribosomal protein S21 [Alphaproteobacteria bacterium]|nr:30S ribosomal protein S21 [Alphaproteobacteria bacterium]
MVKVFVKDNNVEKALRIAKKKAQKEGLFKEVKSRRYHEKPTTAKKRKANEAVKRERKRQSKERQTLGF